MSELLHKTARPLLWGCPKSEFASFLQDGKEYFVEQAKKEGLSLLPSDVDFFYVGTSFYRLEEDKVIVLYNKQAYPRENHHNDGFLTLFAWGLAKQAKDFQNPKQAIRNFFDRNDLMQMKMKFSQDMLLERCLNTLDQMDADKLKGEILEGMGKTSHPNRGHKHLM